MSELSREQVERECQWLVEEHCGSAAKKWLATDAALRATITQQAQELERVKKLMKEREYRDEANATLQLQILADKAKRIDDLKQQLSASQARCREMEQQIHRYEITKAALPEGELKTWRTFTAQLQATLAARELTWTTARPTVAGRYWYKDLDGAHILMIERVHHTDLFVSYEGSLTPLNEYHGEFAGPIPLPTEAQQARGSSGGAANQGAGT